MIDPERKRLCVATEWSLDEYDLETGHRVAQDAVFLQDGTLRIRPQMMLSIDESTGRILDALEATGQLAELSDEAFRDAELDGEDRPCCPYCGSARTTLLAERPRFGEP